MKYIIASDLHGSAYYCEMFLGAIGRENADKIIFLGDILYHGPRNNLPRDYAPKKVIEMLNPLAEKMFCVRGNCDCEVDEMVLAFPCLAEYALIGGEKRTIFASHGHKFGKDNPPPLGKGDILLCGHTHVPALEKFGNDNIYLNPGSLSIPKEGSAHSYMTLDDGVLVWKNLDGGAEYRRFEI